MTAIAYGAVPGPTRTIAAAAWSRRLGVFAVPVLVVAALASRAGLAEGWAAVAAIGAAFVFAGVAALLALYALARIWQDGFDGARAALTGLVTSVAVLAIPLPTAPNLVRQPALTQATTDPTDPPAFRATLRERPARATPTDPLPADFATIQTEAYPTVVPLRVDMPAPEAYALALELVEARGWRIVERVPALAGEAARPARPAIVVRGQRQPPQPAVPARPDTPGRIEAVARTRLFGFRDDVVIRIIGSATESRVDVRSASRIGLHDLGANAQRIVGFLTEMRDRAAER